jgi:poly(hydroxyalkanoate) granule-associated protein
MVRKVHRTDDESATGSDSGTGGADAAAGSAWFTGAVRDSASQIWLAGLGAFAKAQEEGGKVFEALVKEGQSLQRKTQSVAEERLSEATSRMASMATDISSRATGHWDKLESIFEDRVSRALKNLDAPSAQDIEALTARIDELDRRVARLTAAQAKPARAASTGRAAKATGVPNAARRTAAGKRPVRKSGE